MAVWGGATPGYTAGLSRGNTGESRRHRWLWVVLLLMATATVWLLGGGAGAAAAERPEVVELWAEDFTYGTYIIDQPGTYVLMEDVSFNPNSPATLTAAVQSGEIPPEVAGALGWPMPVDAYHAGFPLYTQFLFDGDEPFTPGGPLDARYDPAAYGIGFFAAIAIQADDVVLDLNGHRLEQSAEHALLQRFFAVIELADQPFIPTQGPSGFGTELEAATNVVIRNGTLGRSAHHGIHGNGNRNVTISNVDFDGYEVAAVALNGVEGLKILNSVAENRKDVPVLGTFSSAQFIKAYVEDLVRNGSTTTLTVDGATLTATDIRDDLMEAINNVHHDVIADPNIVDGRAVIDAATHPDEYALFHNKHGVVDGNAYSFLVNQFGVAVQGFPTQPEDPEVTARDILLRNVRVVNQQAFINEIVAINAGDDKAARDPVGALFQVWNLNPATGEPVTISDLDPAQARYTGNAVANAQALVAKAAENGEFDSSPLDITRLNIPVWLQNWVEGASGSETLEAIGATYLCNGDSMFHVNKGVIAFKMDAAVNGRLINTRVDGLVNLGQPGSSLCGDYGDGFSHPGATLPGYGGAATRAYTFAGSRDFVVRGSSVTGLSAMSGPAVGYAVLTDSSGIRFNNARVRGAEADWGPDMPMSEPNGPAYAAGFYFGEDTTRVRVIRGCAVGLDGYDGNYPFHDLSAGATLVGTCRANR